MQNEDTVKVQQGSKQLYGNYEILTQAGETPKGGGGEAGDALGPAPLVEDAGVLSRVVKRNTILTSPQSSEFDSSHTKHYRQLYSHFTTITSFNNTFL